MNEDRQSPKEGPQASADHIGRLLRLAGPRPAAPHEREARVKESIRTQWRKSVRTRRRRRLLVVGGIGLAAAAALIAMVGLLYQPLLTRGPGLDGPVGFVDAVSGTVRLGDGADGAGRMLRVGDTIEAGTVIETGLLGRAAVRLASGASLRLDHDTRLEGLPDSVVSLESGAVYFDSGTTDGGAPVEIRTVFGVVHDVGTLFEIRLAEDRMRVRVREGAVNVDRDGRRHDAGAGIELTVDSEGTLSRRSVPIYGPDWEWVMSIAPTFELEGRTLYTFLEWVNRETGWSPRFVDPRSEERASSVVLHGSIEGMRPDQALEAVLPTCGLVHRLDDGILVIQAEGP